MPPTGENAEPTRGKMGTRLSGKCESVKVTCEANELWRQDLKLHEWWLKVAEKQLVGNSHLVKVVQVLMDALNCTGLGGVSAHGGAGGSGSVQKGKERVDMGAAWGKVMRMVRVMQMVTRRVPRVERRMIKKCNIVEEERKTIIIKKNE